MNPVVGIRCEGGVGIGMGHVSRCLALGRELRDGHGATIVFAMRDADGAGAKAAVAAGFRVVDALSWTASVDALVVDVRDGVTRADLEEIRQRGVKVITIDDGSDRRLASDLAFYPPVPQVAELDWRGAVGRHVAGWPWVILNREFQQEPAPFDQRTVDVLVTMGGADPADMTPFAIRALNRLPSPLTVRVVIGPAFGNVDAIRTAIARSTHHVEVEHSPATLAPLMRSARIAVASFGMSAYELAACGVPAVHIGLTPDHVRSSEAFSREHIAITAGLFTTIPDASIADAVRELLADETARRAMGARARSLVDGAGARRVAAEIVRSLTE